MKIRSVAPGVLLVHHTGSLRHKASTMLPEFGRGELIKAGHSGDPAKIDRAIGLCKTLYPNLFRKENSVL